MKISKKNPVYLIHKNGTKLEFYSFAELIYYIAERSYLLNDIGTSFYDNKDFYFDHTTGEMFWNKFRYIVRDSCDTVFQRKLIVDKVKNTRVAVKHVSELVWSWHQPINYKLRCDPVPFIHHKKKGHYLRHPHTTQEKREWLRLKEIQQDSEYPVHSRAKRSIKSLPGLYDDKPRVYKNKSWKAYRKKQYKGQ